MTTTLIKLHRLHLKPSLFFLLHLKNGIRCGALGRTQEGRGCTQNPAPLSLALSISSIHPFFKLCCPLEDPSGGETATHSTEFMSVRDFQGGR